MNILVTGATGFIGRHVCAGLISRGHRLTAAVRDPASAARRFPGIQSTAIDMNGMLTEDDWRPLLAGQDAVVNCAGILQSTRHQSAQAIHATAPRALFEACVAAGVRRVVHISAVSADAAAGTEYALTKKAADDHLRALDLDWVILRPSLVYAQGSYGGTSAIRGLAGFPLVIPLPGDGGQRFQPLHADDLAETVAHCLETPGLARQTLDPVGPETLTLRQIVEQTRSWLDLPPARPVQVPQSLLRSLARLGDILGEGPLRTTALRQLEYGNVSDAAGFERAIGLRPRRMSEAFRSSPSHGQDRWHARLYFLRPGLTAALSLLWIVSGLVGLLSPPADAQAVIARLGLAGAAGGVLIVALSLFDIGIGAALALSRAWRTIGTLQLGLIAFYTAGLTLLMPELWSDPCGPLLKNLPILAAVAVWMAMQDDK